MGGTKVVWDCIDGSVKSYHLESNIALYRREEHLRLFKKWADKEDLVVLKTDLFEEAFGPDLILDTLSEHHVCYGMDISAEIVKRAKERVPKHVTLVNTDIRDTCFNTETFDLVFSTSTLDHFPKKVLQKSLQDIKRILKNEGLLILTLDNKQNPFYRIGYWLKQHIEKRQCLQERCYSVGEVVHLVDEAGYEIDGLTSVVHIITPFNKIALTMKKVMPRIVFDTIVQMVIDLGRKLTRLPTLYSTGWFIAIKCRK